MNTVLLRHSKRPAVLLTRTLQTLPTSTKLINTRFLSTSKPVFDEWDNQSFRRTRLPLNTIIKFVPQQEAWVVERMGRFDRILEPGLNFLMPILDSVKYVKTLKEVAATVPSQSAITQDNVTLHLDGVLYFRVIDPYKASYGVEDAAFAITQLAQTTMRAEIGQMTLDRTLAERAHLNMNIVKAIDAAALEWGIQCLRYEIRDIHPPIKVVESMHQQVSAERTKRAQILESEGARQAAINVAEGHKQSKILASEAQKAENINQADGEAQAILLRAEASAKSIEVVAQAIGKDQGANAVSMSIAEKYVEAFGQLAKKSTTLIVPASANDAASLVTQALTIYKNISNKPILSRDHI
ncbi:sugar transporter-like protein [Mucor flavus]|uniref:Sugar transporter-like protein n=1 Tax=Mucor flavus TaxID=439312 RepID=A0ABP9Z6M1_9FUNG